METLLQKLESSIEVAPEAHGATSHLRSSQCGSSARAILVASRLSTLEAPAARPPGRRCSSEMSRRAAAPVATAPTVHQLYKAC